MLQNNNNIAGSSIEDNQPLHSALLDGTAWNVQKLLSHGVHNVQQKDSVPLSNEHSPSGTSETRSSSL